jgi:hypothetical protein
MLANAMAEDPALKDVPVNIFAIDPVPGVMNLQTHRVTLPGNVKEYVGFYSRDERSKGFACVIPTVKAGTRMHIYPMPGRHGTLVGNASIDGGAGGGKELAAPGIIVRHFAEVCLTRWGTNQGKCLGLKDEQLDQYDSAINADDEKYLAMRGKSYITVPGLGTAVTEGDKADRFVHVGATNTSFSKVNGSGFEPSEGLALQRQNSKSYKNLR